MTNGHETSGRHDGHDHGRLHGDADRHLAAVENLAVEDGGVRVGAKALGHGRERVVEELHVRAMHEHHRWWLTVGGLAEKPVEIEGRDPPRAGGAQNGSTARATMSRPMIWATGTMAASWRAIVSATTGAAR